MPQKFDYYELRNDGNGDFSVLGFGTYTSGVLKGAPKKVRVKGFRNMTPDAAMQQAVAEFGEMNWFNSFVSASADPWINALPDEPDF